VYVVLSPVHTVAEPRQCGQAFSGLLTGEGVAITE